MESTQDAEKKFEILQKKYIRFLESFCNKNASDTKKLEKAKILLKMLQQNYGGQSITWLTNIEKTLEGMNKIVTAKVVAKSTIKSERTDSPTAPTSTSIKMESKGTDFQSPESPPMFNQDVKSEPITIPTERRDSNQYRYDAPYDSRRSHYADHRTDRDYRIDDYRRGGYDRRRRSRSRSRSYSRSHSRSRSRSRSRERKRHRYSRSRSRSRERKPYSRIRGSHHRRSDSRDKSESPAYRRSSPSSSSRYRRSPSRDRHSHRHRSRSISPRNRHERRDERKYIDLKRGIKLDPDYERDNYKRGTSASIDSKEQLSMTAKTFFKKERERNELTNHGSSNVGSKKPFNTFGGRSSTITATVTSSSSSPSPLSTPSIPLNQPYYNRYSNGASTALASASVTIKREPPKLNAHPHPAMRNRFDSGPSAVELADVERKLISDEDIDECERATKTMLGYIPSEKAKEIEAIDQNIKAYEQLSKIVEDKRMKQVAHAMFNEYDEQEDEEYIKRNEVVAAAAENTSATMAVTDPRFNSSRNSSSGNIKDADQRNERPSIFSRLGDAPSASSSSNVEHRSEQRTNHPNRSYPIDESPQSPDQTPSEIPAPAPKPPREERIAFSDKFVRRPRNPSASGPATSDFNSPLHANTPVAPPQDPRLKNRPSNITSTSNPSVNESPFIPPTYRNQQQQMPASMPHGVNAMNHGFMQDAYHPPPPSQHLPFHPQSGRQNVPNHMQPHPSAMHGYNAGFGSANLPSSHANNLFKAPNMPPFPGQSMHADPRHSRQPQNQFNQQKETYRDYRIRKEIEERRRAEAAAAAASPAISSTTAATDKTEEEQSHSESASKDATKDSTEETVFRKAYCGNNWEALSPPLNKSSGNSFKIPKLGKANAPNNNSTNKSAAVNAVQNMDRSSPIEMNVTTSTMSEKNAQSKKRKDSTKKPSDKKNRNSLDDTSQGDAVAVADTTIHADTDQMGEDKSNEESTPTQQLQQPTDATAKTDFNDILEQLKKHLRPEKLDAVLHIIKPDSANENAVTSSTVLATPTGTQESEVVKKSQATARKSFASRTGPKASTNVEVKTAPGRAKKQKHTNELDRLTADIRENIPDVLSAIGPRSCTLNAAKFTDTSPRKAGAAAKDISCRRSSSGHKSDDDIHSEIVKPSARIVRRRNTTMESRPPIIDDDTDDDSSNDNALDLIKTTAANKRRRKLLDSDDESLSSEPVSVKRRSGPKSKECEKSVQPLEGQKELRIILEKVDESKEMQRITRASKRKAEAEAASSENSEQFEPVAVATEPADTERDVKPVLTIITPSESNDEKQIEKNTNSSYTVKSNKCVLCDRSTQYLSSHYRNHHDTQEVYSARMSSKKASQLRRNPAKQAVRADGKIQAYCYYCESDLQLIRNKWVDHLVRHTGEYTRHCKKCGCIVTSASDKSKCSHPDPICKAIVDFTDTLYVYMCKYCNYTQSQEENLKKHIRHMHETDETNQYEKIILIPNFGRLRAAQRVISADGSESGSSSVSGPVAAAPINIEAFISTEQNEDEIKDAKRLLESTTNDSADAVTAPKRVASGQSIIDRLKARFDNKNRTTPENPVKREVGANETCHEHADQPSIVYRAPDELSMIEKAAEPSSAAASSSSPSLRHGSVIENEYKIELNKTEQDHDASAAVNDGDNSSDENDDDLDQDWESLSSGSEEQVDTAAPNNNISRILISKLPKTSNKTVRSRQQQHKKRAVGLSSMVCKTEKLDDAVNNKAVDAKQKTPETKLSPKMRGLSPRKEEALRVDNIAWNECGGEQKFYCYIGMCGFVSQNNLDSLSNHLRQKHSNAWTGYCHKCDQQIFNNRCSLMKEFEHLKTHLPEKLLSPPPPKLSISAATKANESTPSPTAVQVLTQHVGIAKISVPESPSMAAPIVTPPQPRPLIQVRPLAELLQSPGNAATPATAPMQLQPIQLDPIQSQPPLIITSVSSLKPHNSMPGFNSLISGVSISLASENPLKPWTTCANTKSTFAEEKLRRECSLVALFKCMATDCIFTTSDKAKMLQHLQNHEDMAADSSNAPILDDGCWLECCYCEDIPGSCGLLVEHIIKEHSTSLFQCPQCFYRSVDVRNVFNHLEKYHRPGLDPLICGVEMKDAAIDIKVVVAAQARLPEFLCSDFGCGWPVMYFAEFNSHIKTAHVLRDVFKCTICDQILGKNAAGEVDLKHFRTHGFALCNCPYCPHQCDTMDLMQDHLRDKHSTRFSYALIRIEAVKKSNHSSHNQRFASIYQLVDMPQRYQFTYTKFTEVQINYMDPALDSPQNACDPVKPEHSSIFQDKRAKFIQLYHTESAKEEKLKTEHGIHRASDLLTTSNKRGECFVVKTQPEPSTSTVNAVPIVRAAAAAAAAATTTAPKNVGSSDGVPVPSLSTLDKFDEVYQNEVDASAKLIVESGGDVELDELYHCSYPDCGWVRGNDCEFLAHLSQHDFSGNFECFHCQQRFAMAVDLKKHIKNHQKCRFFCFYCEFMGATEQEMDQHFNRIHGCDSIAVQAVNENHFDMSTDLFVVCPPNADLSPFKAQIIKRASNLKANQRKFRPNETSKLPNVQIFNEELECALCGFGTKVRSNLIRHFRNGCNVMQSHAPINPVNQSNERYFDKMRNLAASSNSSDNALEYGLGKFIPETDRYRCCARSCVYQNSSPDLLLQHIETLHYMDTEFKCPHCSTDLSANCTPKEILNHLRYHESRIYKCPSCSFIHYLKQNVDKHITEQHPTVRGDRAIVLDRPAKKEEPPKTNTSKTGSYKWKCNDCSASFDSRPLVKQHLQTAHRLSYQYKCTICQYSHDTKNNVKEHLSTMHGEVDSSKMKSNYERIEAGEDNSPLWRRNDPSRVKHIRGILFDDAEKSRRGSGGQSSSSKSPLIHLEINPVSTIQIKENSNKTVIVSASGSNKKSTSKVSQDDSVLNFKVSSRDLSNRGNDDRFVILPPREMSTVATVEEEVRPRPASLRQQPKRRFSTYIPSTIDISQQQSTPSTPSTPSTAQQPPISLRFKRISDTIADTEKMPPPKISKVTAKKATPVVSTASAATATMSTTTTTVTTTAPMLTEKVDLNALGLIYLCYHCDFQTDAFDTIHAHWLKVHKKGEDPTTKRFCYRLTKQVRCVYCPNGDSSSFTYQTIREHLAGSHKNSAYAYVKQNPSNTVDKPMECGQCTRILPTITDLQMHFNAKHKNLQKPTPSSIDPLPIINDATLDALLEQGDQGTFKCAYCSCFYSCRYDYEQHHREDHRMIPQKYELNGKYVIKYGCFVCTQMKTDEAVAIEHIRAHFPIGYQCQYCPTQFKFLSAIVPHHETAHDANLPVRFKLTCAQDHFTACTQLILTFSNGLTLLWGDVMNTRFGGEVRLRKWVGNLIDQQNQQQMKAFNELIKSKDFNGKGPAAGSSAGAAGMMAGKIGHRRQTHL